MIYELSLLNKDKIKENDEALIKECQRVVDEYNRLKFKNGNDPDEAEFNKWETKRMFDNDSYFYNDQTKELVLAEDYFRNNIYPHLRFDTKAEAKKRNEDYNEFADKMCAILEKEIDSKSVKYIRQIYDYGFLNPFYEGKSPEEGYEYLMRDGRIRNLIEDLKENYGHEED